VFKRLLGTLFVGFGLTIAALPTAASAAAPASAPVVASHASTTDAVASMSRPCGWSAPDTNAYYNHCGGGRIELTVEFWWGGGDDRYICVGSGVTNLSNHSALQGGLITYAYHNGRSC
jgi:hypothetical protein